MTQYLTAAAAEDLTSAFTELETTLLKLRRLAGSGTTPELERELRAHQRSLRSMLGAEATVLVEDVVDAALRVLDAADPSAPLLVLAMGQRSLGTLIRRQAAQVAMPAAA